MMKQIFGGLILVFCLLFHSCRNEPIESAAREPSKALVEEHMPDTTTFNYFKSRFKSIELPLHLDSAYLMSQKAFIVDSDSSLTDYKQFFIPRYMLENWLIDTNDNTSELQQWYMSYKQFLNDDEWNRYSMHYGFHFKEGLNDYFITYRYHQVSVVNGGNWTYFIHCLDTNHNLLYSKSIGDEIYYTYTRWEDSEDIYYWQRFYEIQTIEIDIQSAEEITVCTYYIEKVSGDILEEQRKLLGRKDVTYDSLIGITRFFPIKCKSL